MATLSSGVSAVACSSHCLPIAAADASCKPEEDAFLLLQSTLRSVQQILLHRRGLPLLRTWIAHPYGEEEVHLLEQELLPALQRCLDRVEELDQRLLAQQELMQRCRLEAGRDALASRRLRLI